VNGGIHPLIELVKFIYVFLKKSSYQNKFISKKNQSLLKS